MIWATARSTRQESMGLHRRLVERRGCDIAAAWHSRLRRRLLPINPVLPVHGRMQQECEHTVSRVGPASTTRHAGVDRDVAHRFASRCFMSKTKPPTLTSNRTAGAGSGSGMRNAPPHRTPAPIAVWERLIRSRLRKLHRSPLERLRHRALLRRTSPWPWACRLRCCPSRQVRW